MIFDWDSDFLQILALFMNVSKLMIVFDDSLAYL